MKFQRLAPFALAITLLPSAAIAQSVPRIHMELEKLRPATGQVGGKFAYVAIDGDTIAVGSPGLSGGSGQVVVFDRTPTGWVESARFRASDTTAADHFGLNLDLDGDVLVVGARGARDDAGVRTGAAYVYRRQGTSWIEEAKLLAPNAGENAAFGFDASVDGDRIAVGAYGINNHRGAAFVFDRVGGQWTETVRLDPTLGGWWRYYGRNVALDGDVLALAGEHVAGAPGTVDLFRLVGGTWQFVTTVESSDAAADDNFGISLDLEAGRLVVGADRAPGAVAGTGAVYVFEESGGSWTETQKIEAWGAEANELFGQSVDLDGDRLFVGARQDRTVAMHAGSARLFELQAGQWEETTVLIPTDTSLAQEFGSTVALDGETMVVGAAYGSTIGQGYGPGASFVFSTSPTDQPFCSTEPCPCANDTSLGGCENVDGRGAVLGAGGSTSVAADDLAVTAFGLPRDAASILFAMTDTASMPAALGNGVLCTTGSATRLGIMPGTAFGFVRWDPGLVATAGWSAGETAYFQAWYRDVGGPCGQTFNLTNATAVTFTP